MKTFEKADRELAEGNLWRAKEILEGSLHNLGYDPELYERLGIVLLRMGDLPAAGRFLFLSGVRKGEYEQAIDIYKKRYSAAGVHQFFSTFPHNARLATLSRYPERVQKELKDLGVPEDLRKFVNRVRSQSVSQKDSFVWLIFLSIAVLVIGLLIAGIVKVVELLELLL